MCNSQQGPLHNPKLEFKKNISLALEVNKSETSSPKFLQKIKIKNNPDLATGYNKFTKCKTKVNNHYLIQSFKLQGLWPKKKIINKG